MRLIPVFTIFCVCCMLVLASFTDSQAQRRRKAPATTPSAAPQPEARPQSVVMLPAGARQEIDTALINPQEPSARKRRRFEVKVVPAAPPGRSRQEIMYTDSIMNRSPKR